MRDAALSIAVPIEPVQPELDEIAALVEQARGGDMAAFEALMRRHERLVMMTALRLLKGNLADAEDAAQTVFLRMHRYLGRFRRGGDISYWLYRITVNVATISTAARKSGPRSQSIHALIFNSQRLARKRRWKTHCGAECWPRDSMNCRRRNAPRSCCATSRASQPAK